MRKYTFEALLCLLFVLAACMQQEITSEQTIQDIVSDTPDVGTANITKAENKTMTQNQTQKINQTKVEVAPGQPLRINKKCRNSAILYDGCKWRDPTQSDFELRIISASKDTIPGTWFIITGESGNIKNVKKAGDILSKGRKLYDVDYAALVKEIGRVTRFEVYPIEVINGTEYACENQRVYTIPETYCKPSEPIKIG
jgi:hypothetical protein